MSIWITPKPLNTFSNEYTPIEENNFLQVLERKSNGFFSFVPTSEDYVIVLKNDEQWVVATALQKKKIFSIWERVLEDCRPLSLEVNVRADMIMFLEAKFTELAVMSSAEQQKTKFLKQNSEQNFFRTQFNLPNETLVTSFVCTYEGVLKAGWLYLSNNYVCFTSRMIPHDVILNLKKVSAIEKEGSFGIIIKTDKKDFMFSLVQRDQAFIAVRQLWNLVMDRVLERAESVLKSLEGARKATNTDSSHMNLLVTPQEKFLGLSGERDNRLKNVQNMKQLNFLLENREFQRLFRLTEKEHLEDCLSDCQFEQEDKEPVKGALFMSVQVFGFVGAFVKPFWIVIPYQDADLGVSSSDLSLLRVTTGTAEFGIRFPPGLLPQTQKRTLIELWTIVKENTKPAPITFSTTPLEGVRQLYESIDENYYSTQKNLENLWTEFFSERKFGRVILRDKSLLDFVHQGIPDSKRGMMWQILSGSIHSRVLSEANYYQSLLEKYANQHSLAIDEIDKDITRSFPHHPFYQQKEGQARLRNVLLAYSWHNEAVGYCQSMNIITALFLLYMDETEAFFLLSCVCETLMPQYYNRAMLGSLVDVHLFGDLMAQVLPDVSKHFKKLGLPVPALTMPWFLCLYIGYVPIEIALRILDAFFCEGYDVLFRVGLAIFKVNQEYILKSEDSYAILVMLKRGVKLTHDLLQIAFKDFGSVSIDDVRHNREVRKAEAIKALDDNTRKDKINSLSNITKFTKDELNNLYNWTQAMTDSMLLTPEQLSGVIIQFCPFWEDLVKEEITVDEPVGELQRQLWRFFTQRSGERDTTLMSFDDLVYGLSQILKGSLSEVWNVCVFLAGCNQDQRLSRAQVIRAIDLLLRMFNVPKQNDELEGFVNMLYDKAELKSDNLIDLDYLKREAIDKPLLLEFFQFDLNSTKLNL